jgi:hypothetical protein
VGESTKSAMRLARARLVCATQTQTWSPASNQADWRTSHVNKGVHLPGMRRRWAMKLMISLFLSPMKLDSLQVPVSVRFFSPHRRGHGQWWPLS